MLLRRQRAGGLILRPGSSYVRVPLTGLEPVVSALRGRRVNHLHYSGKNKLRASVYTAYFIVATERDGRSEHEFKLRRYRARLLTNLAEPLRQPNRHFITHPNSVILQAHTFFFAD